MRRCIQCGRWLRFYDRKVKLLDAVVCRECFDALGLPGHDGGYEGISTNNYADVLRMFKTVSVNDFNRYVQQIRDGETFCPSYAVGDVAQFDDRRREARFVKGAVLGGVSKSYHAVPYDNILDYRLVEDNVCVQQGGLSGAIIGGSLTHSWEGALLGEMAGTNVQDYCKKMRLEIVLKGPGAPTIPLDLIWSKTKRSDWSYRNACEKANKIMSSLTRFWSAAMTMLTG